MIKSRAITSYKGIMSRVGITAQIGIGGGGGSSGSLFDGTYAFYPFATNGNNTVTAGVKINERLGDKIFNNDSGNYVTVGEYETAYTGSGELDEPSATTQIVTDMSAWDLTQSVITYDNVSKENTWTFIGGPVNHRAFYNSAITQGLDYTLSLEVKKGESQFLQITGSAGFDTNIVVNYDLLSGIANDQVSGATLKDFGLIDLGDYFRVYCTIEAFSTSSGGRLITCKCDSLTDSRLPASSDSGAFTVKYPNFVQASYASSPIDAPLAPATRDSDKAAVPTSDVWVDDGCFSGANSTAGGYQQGILRLTDSSFRINFNDPASTSNGKYFNRLPTGAIGAVLLANPAYTLTIVNNPSIATFTHPNNTLQELIDLFGNDGTNTNKYPIAWQYSTLTLAEVTQLRADVGDTPPTEYPDGSFRWLTWPAVDVVFQLDFTLYSNDPNELIHIEWANAAKDTYVARTGDALEFNHGNDTLTIPYANLIVLGDTYKGYAVITPTQLIGYVNGVEVARMTRTDTALAEWSSKCYEGGFNNTLAPVKLANLKVFDYVAPPPVGNLIVSDASSLTGDPNSTGYATVSGGSGVGSLSPPVSIGGVLLEGIYSNNVDIGDGTKKYIFMGDPNGLIEGRVDATFNGVTYEFDSLFGAGSPPGIQSDELYDFLLANRDIPIVFTAEVAPSTLVVDDTTALTGFASNGFAGSSYPIQVGSLTPDAFLNGQQIGGIYTPASGDVGDNKVTVAPLAGQANDFGDSSKFYTLIFDGTGYLFSWDGARFVADSAALKQFIDGKSGTGTSIEFTAEVA